MTVSAELADALVDLLCARRDGAGLSALAASGQRELAKKARLARTILCYSYSDDAFQWGRGL